MKAGGSRAPALQQNFRRIVVRYERFAENLADSGGYDDLTTDAALSVFISTIARHDPRISHGLKPSAESRKRGPAEIVEGGDPAVGREVTLLVSFVVAMLPMGASSVFEWPCCVC
jgi:hypothetical protein